MELKRIYRIPEGWEAEYNERDPSRADEHNLLGLKEPSRDEGVVLNPPPVDHFEVHHTGLSPEQNFSEKMVNAGLAEGFLSISKGQLILHAQPEDLSYKIVRGPGFYCCHCGEPLPDAGIRVKDGEGEETDQTRGMLHVEEKHQGEDSPDRSNPAGYRRVNGFECVLDSSQHKRFNLHEYQKRRASGDIQPRKRSKKRSKRTRSE